YAARPLAKPPRWYCTELTGIAAAGVLGWAVAPVSVADWLPLSGVERCCALDSPSALDSCAAPESAAWFAAVVSAANVGARASGDGVDIGDSGGSGAIDDMGDVEAGPAAG